MSYLTQMAALTTQNFVSAATGIALLIALIRGFARASAKTVGNFWVDLTRSHPLRRSAAAILARALPRLAGHAAEHRPLCRCDDARRRQPDHQPWAGGLADRHQAARHQRRRLLERELVDSLENPTSAQQFPRDGLHPADLGGAHHMFGRMVSNRAAGWAIYAAMSSCSLPASSSAIGPKASAIRTSLRSGSIRPTWKARRCVSASCQLGLVGCGDDRCLDGSVNSMHDSFTPLGGMIPLINIELGEIIYGRRRLRPLRHAADGHRSRSSSPGSWSAARRSTSARRSKRRKSRWRCSPSSSCR